MDFDFIVLGSTNIFCDPKQQMLLLHHWLMVTNLPGLLVFPKQTRLSCNLGQEIYQLGKQRNKKQDGNDLHTKTMSVTTNNEEKLPDDHANSSLKVS